MYSNISNINSYPRMSSSSSYGYSPMMYNSSSNFSNSDRFVGGGFLGPFLLGGITGGLLAPAFYPRPVYPRPIYPRPYGPYPYYGPYYR